jgi:hypothetical protein
VLSTIRAWLRDLNHFGRSFWYCIGTFWALVGIRNLAISDSLLAVTVAAATSVSGLVVLRNARHGDYAEI